MHCMPRVSQRGRIRAAPAPRSGHTAPKMWADLVR
jgi:hypothetical protein